MNSLLAQVREADEDFEWYPSTEEILSSVSEKLKYLYHESFSMLDIGAGDGRVLKRIDELHRIKEEYRTVGGINDKYAIEKSPVLVNALPDDVIVVGTDFIQQTLIDKPVNVIFCNPPYSEFEFWAEKIIKEANCEHLFLVIPQRWKTENMLHVLESRKASYEVVLSTDFENAERSARAKVDVIHISFVKERDRYSSRIEPDVDPFDLWFEQYFPVNSEPSKTEYAKEEEKKAQINSLVKGKDQIPVLVALYRADMDHLISNYKAVGALDRDILKELGIDASNLKKGLMSKIKGLKNLYWHELFSRLSTVTERLTSKTRSDMLHKLDSRLSVDFTENNIYAVICWALKNANSYFDSQLVDVYRKITSKENAFKYKSNIHMTDDSWRYCRGYGDGTLKPHHYGLEYRIVLHVYEAIKTDIWGKPHHDMGLSDNTETYIRDIFTVANNLGFRVKEGLDSRRWEYGKAQTFYLNERDDEGNPEIFCEIKMFKNGNIHVKFNQNFMKAFNIEAARLLGWIKSPKEASEEMKDVSESAAKRFFETNLKMTNVPLLTA